MGHFKRTVWQVYQTLEAKRPIRLFIPLFRVLRPRSRLSLQFRAHLMTSRTAEHSVLSQLLVSRIHFLGRLGARAKLLATKGRRSCGGSRTRFGTIPKGRDRSGTQNQEKRNWAIMIIPSMIVRKSKVLRSRCC